MAGTSPIATQDLDLSTAVDIIYEIQRERNKSFIKKRERNKSSASADTTRTSRPPQPNSTTCRPGCRQLYLD
jgi:hypothetical protein